MGDLVTALSVGLSKSSAISMERLVLAKILGGLTSMLSGNT
jgi:hypothetical protein